MATAAILNIFRMVSTFCMKIKRKIKMAILKLENVEIRHFQNHRWRWPPFCKKRQAQTAEDIDWNYIWFADML